jgi:hypothetical protein
VREKIQKMIFPDRIAYHFKAGAFRTITVNKWLELIPLLGKVSEDNGKNKGGISAALSSLVWTAGFEPTQITPSQYIDDLEVIRSKIDSN